MHTDWHWLKVLRADEAIIVERALSTGQELLRLIAKHLGEGNVFDITKKGAGGPKAALLGAYAFTCLPEVV